MNVSHKAVLRNFVYCVLHKEVSVCFCGNIVRHNNESSSIRRAVLVLTWLTVRGYTVLVFNQASRPGQLSLAIPYRVGVMSIGHGYLSRVSADMVDCSWLYSLGI